jgi:hypothetical protein
MEEGMLEDGLAAAAAEPSSSSAAIDSSRSSGAPPAAASDVQTFDDYLSAAGVHFLEAKGSRAANSRMSIGKGLATHVPGYGEDEDEEGEGLCDRVMVSMVLQQELDVLRWANLELIKGLADQDKTYKEMQEYVESDYPGFFGAQEVLQYADDMKKLKSRCRQMARAFWYDWRKVALEEDSQKKLGEASAQLDDDLSTLSQLKQAADATAMRIESAMPPNSVAQEAEAAFNDARDAANALAFKQSEASRAESSVYSLQQQLSAAEHELARARDNKLAQQNRLAELNSAVALASATAEASAFQAELRGDALASALEQGVAWRPLSLTSTAVALGFGPLGAEPAFELRAAMMPPPPPSATPSQMVGATIHHVELLSKGLAADEAEFNGIPPDAARSTAEAVCVVREGLFQLIHAALLPRVDACKTSPAWRSLVRAVGSQLGRLDDLVGEVKYLAARVPLSAQVEPDGRGVSLSCAYSFYTARTRFCLHLLLVSTDPSQPIQWQMDVDGATGSRQGAEDGSSSTALVQARTPLEVRVGALVQAHSRGFGRLPAIHAALMAAFAAAP